MKQTTKQINKKILDIVNEFYWDLTEPVDRNARVIEQIRELFNRKQKETKCQKNLTSK